MGTIYLLGPFRLDAEAAILFRPPGLESPRPLRKGATLSRSSMLTGPTNR